MNGNGGDIIICYNSKLYPSLLYMYAIVKFAFLYVHCCKVCLLRCSCMALKNNSLLFFGSLHFLNVFVVRTSSFELAIMFVIK